MIRLFREFKKGHELKLNNKQSLSDILNILNIELGRNEKLSLDGKTIDPRLFDQTYVTDGLIVISSGATGEAPTSEVRAVLKWLHRKGYARIPGGKGDHMKLKNASGDTLILNRHNSDKKCICWGSQKSLARAFNMTPSRLYDLLKTI